MVQTTYFRRVEGGSEAAGLAELTAADAASLMTCQGCQVQRQCGLLTSKHAYDHRKIVRSRACHFTTMLGFYRQDGRLNPWEMAGT